MVNYDLAKIAVPTCVTPGSRHGDIAQGRRSEGEEILNLARHLEATKIFESRGPIALARPDLGHGDRVEFLVGLQRATVAVGTAGIAVEEPHALLLVLAHRTLFAAQIAVEGAVIAPPGRPLEGRDGIRCVDVGDVLRRVDMPGKGRLEEFHVFGNRLESLGQESPNSRGSGKIARRARCAYRVLMGLTRHLEVRGHREHGLGGQHVLDARRGRIHMTTDGHLVACRAQEARRLGKIYGEPTIVKESLEFPGREVVDRRCISGDAPLDVFG